MLRFLFFLLILYVVWAALKSYFGRAAKSAVRQASVD